MYRIVPAITSLQQHLEALRRTPQVYRPPSCPQCGLGGLWRHGCYHRKADRRPQTDGVLNPIPIPRFLCRGCRQTCSRLPACIAPRRWYGWAMQQLVLQLLLIGCSLHRCSGRVDLDRRTVRRWWDWLKLRSETFGLVLRSRFPEWGRAVDWKTFWITCLGRMPLCEAIAWLDHDGVVVP